MLNANIFFSYIKCGIRDLLRSTWNLEISKFKNERREWNIRIKGEKTISYLVFAEALTASKVLIDSISPSITENGNAKKSKSIQAKIQWVHVELEIYLRETTQSFLLNPQLIFK